MKKTDVLTLVEGVLDEADEDYCVQVSDEFDIDGGRQVTVWIGHEEDEK